MSQLLTNRKERLDDPKKCDVVSLFGPAPDDIIDAEDIIDIDMDEISEVSLKDATDLVQNLSKFYYNEQFMSENPTFKKRVDAELESLRMLFKMRKSDEVAHDNLMKAIAANSSNASLYRSLSEIQKTILSITTKMGDIITGLNNMMKGYQLELNFKEDEESEESEDHIKDTYRGTKEFINMMNARKSELIFEEKTLDSDEE